MDAVHRAPSETTAAKVQQMGNKQVQVAPIGINPLLISRTPPSSRVSDVLYVGRLTDQKNLDLLLDAVAELGQCGEEPKVKIVGDGPDLDRLLRRAEAMGLQSVEFLGRVESDAEIVALMKSSKLLVQPSLREGFGMVVLEAALCGLPAIAVDSPENAIRELLDPRQLVTPGWSGSLATRIRELLSDDALRLQLADRATGVAVRLLAEASEADDWWSRTSEGALAS
jgi:glycosyltransferase involved in cell wall biosynthesis